MTKIANTMCLYSYNRGINIQKSDCHSTKQSTAEISAFVIVSKLQNIDRKLNEDSLPLNVT